MSIIEILTNSQILVSSLIFIAVVSAIEFLGTQSKNKINGSATLSWLINQASIPMARAAAIVLFILLCYPALFATTQAPHIESVLDSGRSYYNWMYNLVFFSTLLLPLIPVMGNMTAFLLPIQGIAFSALFYLWTQASITGQAIEYWPTILTFLYIIFFASITHYLATLASFDLSKRLKHFKYHASVEPLTYNVLLVVMQIPVVLLYSIALAKHIKL